MGYLDQRTPIAEIGAGPEPAPRDLLADLVAVLGEQRVPAADVPALLRDLAPDHAPYRGLTGVKLREILEREYGIKVASTGNRYPVDPKDPHLHRPARGRRPRRSVGLTVEAIGKVPLRARTSARSDTPTGLTRLTLRRSAPVYRSGGDQVKFLTPTVGPNSPAIATQGQSTCRTDALSIARPTCGVGGLHHQLEHLIAEPDPIDHLATPLVTPRATSTETITVVGVRRGARRTAAFATPPPITRASRR
jgi:hypothetical protein